MIGITVALGGCFLAIRWGLRDASPLWFAALRAGVAAAALVAVAAVQRRPLPRSLREWGEIALLGLVNVSLVFAAMFLGVAGLATGTAAVLSNAQPLLILLPAWFLYGEKPSRHARGIHGPGDRRGPRRRRYRGDVGADRRPGRHGRHVVGAAPALVRCRGG
jgi:drug/metabolite transporter (DMT)-like permease